MGENKMNICQYGCRQEAKYKLKNGKLCCSDSPNKCIEKRRKDSFRKKGIDPKVLPSKDKNPAYKKCYCKFCNLEMIHSRIEVHESLCYLNPKNLKLCPVCNNPVKDYRGSTTCSHKCGNNLFKPHTKNYENLGDYCDGYRRICFLYHGKKCIICGEEILVNAHHIDENKKNDSPENLIPLCPTHHQFMHSKYKGLLLERIKFYIEQFIRNGPLAQVD
jgi:hypothetical protein